MNLPSLGCGGTLIKSCLYDAIVSWGVLRRSYAIASSLRMACVASTMFFRAPIDSGHVRVLSPQSGFTTKLPTSMHSRKVFNFS